MRRRRLTAGELARWPEVPAGRAEIGVRLTDPPRQRPTACTVTLSTGAVIELRAPREGEEADSEMVVLSVNGDPWIPVDPEQASLALHPKDGGA